MMRMFFTLVAAIAGMALSAPVAHAEIDGHGPDAWRVTGVAADDVLNMRMGPGTEYLAIDQLAANARNLELITCVPLLIQPIYSRLSEAQRAALPPRWCLMRSSDFSKAGWVSQRFIMEDGLEEVMRSTPAAESAIPVQVIGDAEIDEAAFLVRDLYEAFARSNSRADNPFMRPEAEKYFFIAIIPEMEGHGTDVLYDAQDFEGSVTRIAPDPVHPMLRGMITINVDFINWGQENRAVFSLRPDFDRADKAIRIFRVEFDERGYP